MGLEYILRFIYQKKLLTATSQIIITYPQQIRPTVSFREGTLVGKKAFSRVKKKEPHEVIQGDGMEVDLLGGSSQL